MKPPRRWTKKRRLLATAVRLYAEDRELVYLAAEREGLSQSAFLRVAIRQHATRVLAEEGKGMS